MRPPATTLPHTRSTALHPFLGTSETRQTPQGARLLVWLVVGAAVVAAPTALQANQVYKACGKKWTRQISKLDAEKVTWMTRARSARLAGDLDGDGRPDTLVMTNTPSFRTCNVKARWDRRETTIRIDYGSGRTKVFYWINGLLVEKMTLYPTLGRILVSGTDAEGGSVSRWVDYASPDGSPPAAATDTLALASDLSPSQIAAR